MYAIVNKLTLAKPLDAALLERVENEMFPLARARNPGFLDAHVVRVSDTEVILLAYYATMEALDDVSKNVAGPWFAENVRSYLAGPVDRKVGEVVARMKS
jgi:hypothetical protein